MIETSYSIDFEKIVLPHWSIVGHISEVPNVGDSFTVNIGNESIIIVKDNFNNINAFLNVCPHRGARICNPGKSNIDRLVCPYHSWDFELNGKGTNASLRKFQTVIFGGLILVSLADNPLLLNNFRKDILMCAKAYGWESAKVAHRETFSFNVNWKVVLQDYLECYHCPNVHPLYAKVHGSEAQRFLGIDPTAANPTNPNHDGVYIPTTDHWIHKDYKDIEQEPITVYQNKLMNNDIVTGSKDGSPIAPLMGKYKNKNYDRTRTGVIFGFLNSTMSYPDYTVIYRLIPKSDKYTESEIIWLVDKDAVEGKDYNVNDLIYLWKHTILEDIEFLTKVQDGTSSYFFNSSGKLKNNLEESVVRFTQWYNKNVRETIQ